MVKGRLHDYEGGVAIDRVIKDTYELFLIDFRVGLSFPRCRSRMGRNFSATSITQPRSICNTENLGFMVKIGLSFLRGMR